MATSPATRPGSKRPSRWRSVLAALVSLALALSFLHGSDVGADDGLLTVAAMQSGGDCSGKSAPDWGAPHGDHCLAHVTTVAPHDDAAMIEYVTRAYRRADMLVPDAADLASPFKPPRA